MPFAQVGYSTPLNNINGSLVNVDNSHYSGSAFTSRVIPSSVNSNVFPEPLSNRQAANSFIPGCTTGGSKKTNKRKFKNIYNMYKMKKMSLSKLKKKIFTSRRRKSKKSKSNKSKSNKYTSKRNSKRSRKSKKQRGGYAQYQNNLPITNTYSLGGYLSPNESALASPPPYQVLSNCTNCVDNYSRFTNNGFPSKGSY